MNAFLSTGKTVVLLWALLALTACSSVPIHEARQAFQRGNYDEAVKLLSSKDIRSKDRLLALMEKGLFQHTVGDYKESSQTFITAAKFLEEKDFISIGEQTASLAINEWVTTYKGEYSERLWIHTFQMMNFLLLGKSESAAVEARRALKVFSQFPEILEQAYFTRALAGISFDAAGLPNDAYIEYKKLAELLPDPASISSTLVERAVRVGALDVARQYQTNKDSQDNNKDAEIIVFMSQGHIPKKIPSDLFVTIDSRISFPAYNLSVNEAVRGSGYNNSRSAAFQNVVAEINQQKAASTLISTDLGSVAQRSLSARGKKIAAKQIARVAAKHALVSAVESETETGAFLLSAALFLLEEADTRGWDSLPGKLELLRIPVPSGRHDVTLSIPGPQFQPTSPNSQLQNNQIQTKPTLPKPPLLELKNLVVKKGDTLFFRAHLP